MHHTSTHNLDLAAADSFGLWLRHRRVAQGLTQERLAKLAGYAPSTIRKLEADERSPSHEVVARLAQVLGAAPHELPAVLRPTRIPHSKADTTELVVSESAWMWPDWLPLIGREQESALIRNRLGRGNVRLLTLHGPSGVGKTRLALHIAADMCATTIVCVVRLAPAMNEQQFIGTIARALNLISTSAQELVEALRERRLVLVLDQLCETAAHIGLVKYLLDRCMHIQIVVTSQAPLCLPGERPLLVKPLAYLPPDVRASVIGVMNVPAVMLFVARAQVATPTFALTEANVQAIAALCAHVHGLPQAIELLAARVQRYEPATLLHQLRETSTQTSRSSTTYQLEHGLAQVLAWSCGLLSKSERRVLHQLTAFDKEWTLSTAETRCVRDNLLPVEVLDAIEVLHNAGLVYALPPDGDEPRFAMSEAVRVFALGEEPEQR